MSFSSKEKHGLTVENAYNTNLFKNIYKSCNIVTPHLGYVMILVQNQGPSFY